MDITLGDLLKLEPRLRLAPGCRGTEEGNAALDRDVSWAVSARGTAPHLPQLRGGELILLPARVAAAVGRDLPALLRETATRGASAVVTDAEAMAASCALAGEALVVLVWDAPIGPDVETAINRLLTERRGDLYRIGSELERSLTDVALSGGGLEALVLAVANATGLSLFLRDAGGHLLAEAGRAEAADPMLAAGLPGTGVERKVQGNAVLEIDPATAPLAIIARSYADRIASAVTTALQRDEATRPRGTRRLEAIERLLSAESLSAAERRSLALAVGLDPDGLYFVAISQGAAEGGVARVLGTLGTVWAAGTQEGLRTCLVVAERVTGESLATRVADAKRRWTRLAADEPGFLALSAPASGVAALPAAAAEARFLADFQRRSFTAPRAASFDSVADVGTLRLIFQLRESSALRAFVSEAIGPLAAQDARGVLRTTLLTFLECGGSHVDAAEQLHIHRNTLTYRLRRIAAIVGREVTDPSSWLTLHLALRAAEVIDDAAGASRAPN
jgi:PucR family transcriptional regulator, purine catabolism regulatory protein